MNDEHFERKDELQQKLVELFKDNYASLMRYGGKIVSDEEVVKDCIQDCFYDLWQKSDKLMAVENIKHYLLGMLRRSILKKVKVQSKKVSLDEIHEQFELSIESTLIDNEQQQINSVRLQQVLSELSPKQREIIYLKFQEQLSYQEIEEITSTNYQSIRNLLSKAINNLRQGLLFLFF